MSTMSGRPTPQQMTVLLDFMDKHRKLASGKMRGGHEDRKESKRLWHRITKILNAMEGPTKPPKSWIKFWADKKSSVKTKVLTAGDTSTLYKDIDRRIWNSFLSDDPAHYVMKKKPKDEPNFTNDTFSNDNDDSAKDVNIEFDVEEHPNGDIEEKQINLMKKVVNFMQEQTSALFQISQAVQANATAIERLAEASQMQARAIERIASSFEGVGMAALDVRDAVVDIDLNVKRFYTTP